MADSDHIFFDGYSRPRNRERYFVTPEGDSGIIGDVCTPDGRGGDVACDEEPCVTPRKRRCSPYENIRRVMHERVSTQSERIIGCQPDFLEMTEAIDVNYISFTEDRRPSGASSGEPVLLLDGMLQIVSNVRRNCMDVLCDHLVEAARSYVAAQSEDVLVNSEGYMFPSIPASTMNLLPWRG